VAEIREGMRALDAVTSVTVGELRNKGRGVLARVERGERDATAARSPSCLHQLALTDRR
jgi:hypothetical protein